MLDFSAIPVKLGEPKRLATLGFGAGALILGTAVESVRLKYVLFGVGLVALSMTLAGYLNPVTVHPGLAASGAIPAWFGKWTSTGTRNVSTPFIPKPWVTYGSGSGVVDVGKGKVFPVYGEAYGSTGASAYIPAGPATLGIAEVVNRYQAEPAYMRYVTGVENEGKIVGQGG